MDRNVFDYNRHSMAAGGETGTGYRFYRNLPLEDARTTCDFDGDGDGDGDTFHATRATWWFQSSRLGGRFVYLYQSPATGSALTLGDANGDGLCDVTVNGQVVATDPNVSIGQGQWTTVPFLVANGDAVARAALLTAGLTAGTVTIVPSTAPKGTVVDQSQHFNYVRPKGTTVNLTESGGQATVPDVVGAWQADALKAISNAGLTNDTPGAQPNCIDPGTVFSQSPKAGTLVLPGATVHITVATCTNTTEPK